MRTELPHVLFDHASFESRRALISPLAGLGILAVFHYVPLPLSPMGLRCGGCHGDYPVTEDLVIDAVHAFCC